MAEWCPGPRAACPLDTGQPTAGAVRRGLIGGDCERRPWSRTQDSETREKGTEGRLRVRAGCRTDNESELADGESSENRRRADVRQPEPITAPAWNPTDRHDGFGSLACRPSRREPPSLSPWPSNACKGGGGGERAGCQAVAQSSLPAAPTVDRLGSWLPDARLAMPSSVILMTLAAAAAAVWDTYCRYSMYIVPGWLGCVSGLCNDGSMVLVFKVPGNRVNRTERGMDTGQDSTGLTVTATRHGNRVRQRGRATDTSLRPVHWEVAVRSQVVSLHSRPPIGTLH